MMCFVLQRHDRFRLRDRSLACRFQAICQPVADVDFYSRPISEFFRPMSSEQRD